MARTVLVIGGQGVLGAFVAREFSAAGWQVTRAGRRVEDAPDFRLVDLDDQADLGRACAAVDLVVNTAHHPALTPERTVLREGGTLINLTDLTEDERSELSREGAAGPGLVVADTGLSGIAYLAIAEMLGRHPDADAADYSLMFSAAGSSGRAGALFAHDLLTRSPHHETAMIPFPAPVGTRRGLEVGAGGSTGVRQRIAGVPLRHYLCMQPRALNGVLLALNSMRLISTLPAASFTAGTRKVPVELSAEPICEWFAVSRGGERVAARTLAGRGYYRMTAGATVSFAEALSDQRTRNDASGLRSIEEVIDFADVAPAIEARGIQVRDQSAHVR